MSPPLILKRASASRPSGEWNDDDYDVLVDGLVVGRIFEANAAPVASPWMWTLAFGHHEDRTPTHGYEPTRAGRASPAPDPSGGMTFSLRANGCRQIRPVALPNST
jgi:hypothetical protein